MGTLSKSAGWVVGGRGPVNPMELAVERLGSSIRLGVFPIGTQLPPERDLASLIGVSRSTVREAIRLLTEQGALEAHRGRSGGTFVVGEPYHPSLDQIKADLRARGTSLTEILDQRWAVETAVAQLAAERATLPHLARLRSLLGVMEAAHDDTATYRAADTGFHLLLVESAGSARLGELLAQSHRELADLMAVVPHSADIRRHSSGQHRRLVRAIERRRGDLARAVMDEHVSATASFLVGLVGLDQADGTGTPGLSAVPAHHGAG